MIGPLVNCSSMNQDSYSTKYQSVVSVFNQSHCVDTITGIPMQYALHVLAVPSSQLVVNPIGILAKVFYDYLARKSVMAYSTNLPKVSYAVVGLDMDTYHNTMAPASDVWIFSEGIVRTQSYMKTPYYLAGAAADMELRLTAAAVADYMQVDSASAKQTIDLSRQDVIINLYMKVKAHLLSYQEMTNYGVLLADGDAQLSTGHPIEAAATSAKAHLRQGQHLSDADSNSNSNLHRCLSEWRMNIVQPNFDYTVSLVAGIVASFNSRWFEKKWPAQNNHLTPVTRNSPQGPRARASKPLKGGCYEVDEKEDDAANIGMIVGIVMGCVVGIPIFVWVIWCLYRCCQEKRTSAAVKATSKDNPMYSTQNNVSAHNGSYNHPSDGGKKYPQEAANQGHPGAYQVQHAPGVHDPYPRGSVHSNGSHPYASSPHRAMLVPNQEELNRQYYSGSARVHDPYGQLQPQRSYALASQAASNRANSNTASPLAMQEWNQSRQGSHLSSYSAGGAPPDHVWSSRNNSAGPLRNLGGEQASAANHVIDYPLNAAPGPAPTATRSRRRVSWAGATSAPPAGLTPACLPTTSPTEMTI
eukprot:gene22648-29797_t